MDAAHRELQGGDLFPLGVGEGGRDRHDAGGGLGDLLRPRGSREVVLSLHATGNMEEQEYTSSLEGFVNLYEDEVPFITR